VFGYNTEEVGGRSGGSFGVTCLMESEDARRKSLEVCTNTRRLP
jgi:hypothetical protein